MRDASHEHGAFGPSGRSTGTEGSMSPLLAGFTWLLVFQCLGEALARFLSLAVPGPVVGMALLFVVLLLRPQTADHIGPAADGLARHLSLLFVPAGVGVMLYASRLAAESLAIVVALLASTALAIAVAALTFAALARATDERADDGGVT
jgi:holin-like protein